MFLLTYPSQVRFVMETKTKVVGLSYTPKFSSNVVSLDDSQSPNGLIGEENKFLIFRELVGPFRVGILRRLLQIHSSVLIIGRAVNYVETLLADGLAPSDFEKITYCLAPGHSPEALRHKLPLSVACAELTWEKMNWNTTAYDCAILDDSISTLGITDAALEWTLRSIKNILQWGSPIICLVEDVKRTYARQYFFPQPDPLICVDLMTSPSHEADGSALLRFSGNRVYGAQMLSLPRLIRVVDLVGGSIVVETPGEYRTREFSDMLLDSSLTGKDEDLKHFKICTIEFPATTPIDLFTGVDADCSMKFDVITRDELPYRLRFSSIFSPHPLSYEDLVEFSSGLFVTAAGSRDVSGRLLYVPQNGGQFFLHLPSSNLCGTIPSLGSQCPTEFLVDIGISLIEESDDGSVVVSFCVEDVIACASLPVDPGYVNRIQEVAELNRRYNMDLAFMGLFKSEHLDACVAQESMRGEKSLVFIPMYGKCQSPFLGRDEVSYSNWAELRRVVTLKIPTKFLRYLSYTMPLGRDVEIPTSSYSLVNINLLTETIEAAFGIDDIVLMTAEGSRDITTLDEVRSLTTGVPYIEVLLFLRDRVHNRIPVESVYGLTYRLKGELALFAKNSSKAVDAELAVKCVEASYINALAATYPGPIGFKTQAAESSLAIYAERFAHWTQQRLATEKR